MLTIVSTNKNPKQPRKTSTKSAPTYTEFKKLIVPDLALSSYFFSVLSYSW